MIIAGVLLDKLGSDILKKLGVKDSKMLFPKERERLALEIKKIVLDFEIIKILPKEIDNAVKTPGYNLNKLEAAKMAEAVNRLTESDKTKDAKVTIYVDCPSNNILAWRNVLLGFVQRKDLHFMVEHKADVNHVACSAASILAKVTRDEEIEKLKKQYDFDCGSGYPSDPNCVRFLKTDRVNELAEKGVIRTSWKTFKNSHAGKKQKTLF